jgi:hypothetical protein
MTALTARLAGPFVFRERLLMLGLAKPTIPRDI